MNFGKYEFVHRGYKLVFEPDEKSAAIFLGREQVYEAREHSEIAKRDEVTEWDGDIPKKIIPVEANETVTALVDGIRWINADIKARKQAAESPAVEQPEDES